MLFWQAQRWLKKIEVLTRIYGTLIRRNCNLKSPTLHRRNSLSPTVRLEVLNCRCIKTLGITYNRNVKAVHNVLITCIEFYVYVQQSQLLVCLASSQWILKQFFLYLKIMLSRNKAWKIADENLDFTLWMLPVFASESIYVKRISQRVHSHNSSVCAVN